MGGWLLRWWKLGVELLVLSCLPGEAAYRLRESCAGSPPSAELPLKHILEGGMLSPISLQRYSPAINQNFIWLLRISFKSHQSLGTLASILEAPESATAGGQVCTKELILHCTSITNQVQYE
jgi:hypothetical protein